MSEKFQSWEEFRKELAEKLGVSRQAVSKWERSEASPDTDNLIELAHIYGVTLDELLNGEEAVELIKENKVSLSVMKKCGFKNIFAGIGKYHGIDREIVKNAWTQKGNVDKN